MAVAHLLALAQTLLVAQVGLGLILLAQHKHAAEKLHYAYGAFAVLAAFAPWLYAPTRARGSPGSPARRSSPPPPPPPPPTHDGMGEVYNDRRRPQGAMRASAHAHAQATACA